MKAIAKKLHRDRDEILNFCSKFDRIHIFGTGFVGDYMFRYLKEENITGKTYIGFLYTFKTKIDSRRYNKKIIEWEEKECRLSAVTTRKNIIGASCITQT